MPGGYISLTRSAKQSPLIFLTTEYHLDWAYHTINIKNILTTVITIYMTEGEFAMFFITQETREIYERIKKILPLTMDLQIHYKDPSLKPYKFS